MMPILTLTERAANRISEIITSADPPVAGVRLGIKNGGCAGMSYTLDRVEEPRSGDDVVTEQGVTVYIDPGATLFLLGTEMDYEVNALSSGFVFNNPNQIGACGCGESVSLVAAPKPDA